ncbi:redox-sensing transcriptional repressor Rex [bacterium]|nr:redox-sensing transcriptional repressor Rex [bacterium]
MKDIFKISISRVTLRRLADYLCILLQLPVERFKQISSAQFAKIIGSKPSRVRQDFHYFGGFGKPGHPYDVGILLSELKQVFGLDDRIGILIVGATPAAEMLLNNSMLKTLNIHIAGIVDFNRRKIDKDFHGHKIRAPKDVPALKADNNIKIGVITCEEPEPAVKLLVENNIRGIWNLSPRHVSAPKGFHIRYENITGGLLHLLYDLIEL